jgi:hypothetical protein
MAIVIMLDLLIVAIDLYLYLNFQVDPKICAK